MILIKNGKIMTMEGEDYDKGAVLIKGSKIVAVGEHIEETEEMEVIDVEGAWVMPGIIEAHCHIGLMEEGLGSEGVDVNESVNPVTPQLRAIDAVNPMDSAFEDAVKAGVTCVMTGPGSANVIGGQFVLMKTAGYSLEERIVLEPAAMKVAFGENPKRVYSSKGPKTRMATAAVLREELFNIKNYSLQKEKAKETGEKFVTDFKKEALLPVIDKKLPLKAHAHRSDDILTAIRIAKEFDVDMTLDHCSEGHLIAHEVAASGFPAIIGPTLSRKSKVELVHKTFKTAGVLNKKGVKVAITTDHPVIPIQYLPICAGFAAKEGLGIEEGLKAITKYPAEICKASNRIGTIAVGKDADLAIFSGNPMETFTETLLTLIDGEIVYKK